MSHNGVPTYHPDLVSKIADMFRDGSTITQVAARKLGVTRKTYYAWKETYPEFGEQAEYGEQLAQSYHEDKLDQTADGAIEGANSACRIFIMKSRFRESYHETTKDEKPVSETLLEKLLEKL
jgi:DNA-binding XRE family transcriptional regulator